MNTNKNPLVSICCITYNHENYIKQAIEGFLMQKTNFGYEIVIGEDYSIDGTRKIVFNFIKKYPNLIKVIISNKNIGMQKNLIRTIQSCSGKYIALCEGDDYWTDLYKLQKQVDFLEANPEYSISFHATEYLNMDTGIKTIHKYKCKNNFRSFTIKDAILKGGEFMTTNSIVFRAEFIKNLPEWYYEAPTGDFALSLIISSHGKIAYFDDIMSVYRKCVKGSWTHRNRGFQKHKLLIEKTSKMLNNFNKWTNKKYLIFLIYKIFKNRISFAIIYLRNLSNKIKKLF